MAAQSASLTINVIANAAKAKAGFKEAEQSALGLKGQIGKLKDQLIGKAGLAAGFTAIVALATKAMGAFTDLAKRSIDFGKAAGLSTEQASRWIAVADDMGVAAESLTGAFKAINKDIDDAKWDKYGIKTRTATGYVRDANDVFLDTLDTLNKIKNPTERAQAGTELLGKAWGSVAPMVGKSRKEYERMLASVSAGQVITKAEAQRAEELRLAQDRLNDAIGELTIAFGQLLASLGPVIDGTAKVIEVVAQGVSILSGQDEKSLSGAAKDAATQLEGLHGNLQGTAETIHALAKESQKASPAMARYGKVIQDLGGFGILGGGTNDAGEKAIATIDGFNALIEENPILARDAYIALKEWYAQSDDPVHGKAVREQAAAWGINAASLQIMGIHANQAAEDQEALDLILEEQMDLVDGLTSEWEDYLGVLDIDAAAENAKNALLDLTYAFDDPTTATNEFKEAQRQAAQEVADFIKNAKDIPEDVQLQLKADLAAGNLPAVWSVIDQYMKDNPLPTYYAAPFWVQNANYTKATYGSVPFPKGPATKTNVDGQAADGGYMMGGQTFLVGENGPELFTSNTSGTIIPNGAFGTTAGGTVQNITINMPAGATGAEVLRALQQEARRTGQLALPVSSKTVR